MRKNEKRSHAQKWPRFVATTSELDHINVASQLQHGILLARAMSTRASSPNQPQERCKTVHVAMNVGWNENG